MSDEWMTGEHIAAALEGIQENPVAQAYERASRQGGPQTEYALLMAGGDMEVRSPRPDRLERRYPVSEWIRDQQQNGCKVYRRRIVVIEDWTEVEGEATS